MSFLKGQTRLIKRTAFTKTLGFIISLVAGLTIYIMQPQGDFTLLYIGLFFWYPTIGGIIGLMGIMDKHPLFKHWNLYIWRALAVGAFMNAMLALIALDPLRDFVLALSGVTFSTGGFIAGAALEGAIIAILMDYFATSYYGEGKDLMKKTKFKRKK